MLNLAHPLALQQNTVTVGGGSLAFAAGNTSPSIGGLAGAGGFALTTAASEAVALNVGGNGQSTAYSGNLSGAGGLVKVGSGMLTLSASSGYSGATNVSTGTLQLVGVPTAPVAGYSVWFDASKLGLTNGAAVTSLPDLSGNGHNATPATGSGVSNPTYTAGAVNGLGAVTFTGKQGLLFSEDSSIRETFSIFKGSSFLMTDQNSYNFHRSEAPNATDNDPTASLWGNDASTFNNSSGTSYINGVVQNNAAITNTTGVMPTNLNNGYNLVDVATGGNVAANGFNDDRNFVHYAGNGGSGSQSQGEVIIYNSLLTNAQRQAVEAYLMYKWFGTVAPGFAGSNILPVSTPLSVSAGATLDLDGVSQQVASLTGGGLVVNSAASSPAVFTVGDSSSTAFAGTIAGSGAANKIGLVKVGGGVLTLTGVNTYSGSTAIGGGTLQLGNGAPGQDGSIGGTSAVADGAALLYNLAGSQTASYAISGSGSVTKAGSGTLTLAKADSYRGGTNIQSGLVALANFDSSLPLGPLAMSGGSLDLHGNSPTVTTLNGSGKIGNGASGAANESFFGVTAGGAFSGTIGDGDFGGDAPVSLTVYGGTLTMSGTNTFSGGTTVSGGALILTNNEALTDGSSLTVGDASQFSAPVVPAASAVAAVPEPGTLAVVGIAGLIAAVAARKRRRTAK